ncbi:MAG: hypothetical protein KJ659_11245 [Actinobacteria bacterium]|nr:hypothetical protein [Actinomycetota bacterium]MBU1607925.1 hypothetical protein [Actinomycetota bacterium]MBU2316101.1 hypothetical protein [Actinomycetota bacterium]MBU2386049.1 hypothetical protein [Actinomycetota bacterium]
MSNFFGADVEQLRSLGQEIAQRAQELNAVAARMTARVDEVSWTGPDGQRFKTRWAAELAVDLRRVAARMEDAAQAALSNAREQEEKSGGRVGSRKAPPFATTFPEPIVRGGPSDGEQPAEDPSREGSLPRFIPDVRDAEYKEGRDYVVVDGESVRVRTDPADPTRSYIELDGRQVEPGDADWPPLSPRRFIPGSVAESQ